MRVKLRLSGCLCRARLVKKRDRKANFFRSIYLMHGKRFKDMRHETRKERERYDRDRGVESERKSEGRETRSREKESGDERGKKDWKEKERRKDDEEREREREQMSGK